jgi:o-succinylbenzoate---CoA ligase
MHYCIIYQAKVKTPHKVAITLENKNLTYLELDNLIQITQLKLKKYQCIALIPYLSFESIIIIFAAMRENIKLCLLNQKNPFKYNEKIIALCKAEIIIDSLLKLKKFVKKNQLTCNQIAKISNEASLLIPTSGSSSIPKIVCLSYFNFLSNALIANSKLNFNDLDNWILTLPLFHVAGIAILFRVFSKGATLTIAHDKNLAKVRGNFISLVPTQLKQILENYFLYKNKYKCILIGGAHLSECDFLKAKKLQLNLSMSYGMSEAASQILLSQSPKLINGLYYLGFPENHCQIQINKQNLLSIKGDAVFKNYYNQRLESNWFETQDILHFHKEYGYAFFARVNEMFISGGENIHPEEIERELLKCKGIKQAYVIGKENKLYGHVPVAFILGENYCIKKIVTKLLRHLPKYKIPTNFFKISLQDFNGIKCSREKLKKMLK